MQFLIFYYGNIIKIGTVLFIALLLLFSPALSSAAPIIYGRIFYLGNSLGGVALQFSGEGQTITDPDGYYSKSITSGWSGTVTPSKTDYEFVPPSVSYTTVQTDYADQDYNGVKTEFPDINVNPTQIDIYESSTSSSPKLSADLRLKTRSGAFKLDKRLENKLTSISANEKIPIIIQFNKKIDKDYLKSKFKFYRKSLKKKFVASELKAFSKNYQKNVKRFLELNIKTKKVQKIVPLWAVNCIGCWASEDVISFITQNFEEVATVWLDDIESQPFGGEMNVVSKRADSSPESIEWNIDRVKATDVWALGYTGDGVTVGIIDTGVNYNHFDLQDHMWDGGAAYPNHGYDFVDYDNDPMDSHGHGTHTAGTIAGDGSSGINTGVAPDAVIMAVRAVPGNFSQLADAVQYCLDQGADVISMSAGWGYYNNYCSYTPIPDYLRSDLRDLANTVLSAGVVWVVAAGNDADCSGATPPYLMNAPADVPSPWFGGGGHSSVIAVGATNTSNTLAGFSNNGPVVWDMLPNYNDYPGSAGLIKPNISAPGVGITSLYYSSNTGYAYNWNGTSMATPHVAGVISLMLQKNVNLSPEDIDRILFQTAVDLGPPGMDNFYGAGLVDALAAVNEVTTGGEDVFTIANTGNAALMIDTISADPDKGWLTLSPSVPPELTILPNENSTIQCIVNWQSVSYPSEQTTIAINSNDPDNNPVYITVTAHPRQKFVLTMAVNSESGGTTEPSAGSYTYYDGVIVPIFAFPAEGYQFVDWTGDVNDPNSGSTTVTIDGDKTVTANFISEYVLGDCNENGRIDIGDAVWLVNWLLGSGDPPNPIGRGDLNQNGRIDIGDVVMIINDYTNISQPPESQMLAKNISRISVHKPVIDTPGTIALASLNRGENAFLLDVETETDVAGVFVKIGYDSSQLSIGIPTLAQRCDGMNLGYNVTDYDLNIIIYSMEGKSIESGNGTILSIPVRPVEGVLSYDVVGLTIDDISLSDSMGSLIPVETVNLSASLESSVGEAPLNMEIRLNQNYPNPFNPDTMVGFTIPSANNDVYVELNIYNLQGQLVRTLINTNMSAGFHSVKWGGKDVTGKEVSGGMYIYQLKVNDFVETKKMLFMK